MKSAKELFLPIKEYEGLYSISNYGNVKSNERKVKNKNGFRIVREKILKPSISSNGYYTVALCKNSKMHTHTIHKLVIEHFNRCRLNNEVINHIDHNKLNNHIENLEYITQKENINKEIEIGNWNKIKVLQYDKQNNLINEFESMQEASNKTNIANGDISRCCNNIRKTAGGFIWKKNYNQ